MYLRLTAHRHRMKVSAGRGSATDHLTLTIRVLATSHLKFFKRFVDEVSQIFSLLLAVLDAVSQVHCKRRGWVKFSQRATAYMTYDYFA